ncbi:MAG TPA: SCO family protein [Candidatus Binatia bacterium]|nr:SCO family protein [Candidatus Binatia bacterium]
MIAVLAAVLATVIPVHGVVIQGLADRSAIVRIDPVPAMQPATIRRYRFAPQTGFAAGTAIDALLDPRGNPPILHDAIAAAPFAPGLPDSGRAVLIEPGSPLPAARLVDQRGRIVVLDDAFRGKTLLLSFVFTRCPDRTLCPEISAKFAYMQERLDPRRFALAEITLDPQYDSPAILAQYGRGYGARSPAWTMLTGTGSTIQRLLDQFHISSMRVSTSNFLHDDRLFIVAPDGRVADVVESADWDPQSAIAQARAVSGLASNPFERFKLALIANVIALCGGSRFGGIALLELSLFTLLTAFALLGMWAVARVLWRPG